MDKRDKDKGAFLKDKCFAPHMATAKQNVKATRTDFDAIRAQWASMPWGDFQVLYGSRNGQMVVFDPFVQVNPTDKKVIDEALDRWNDAITELEKSP